MYEVHDALLCISTGSYVDQKLPRRRVTDQHYFKSTEEMSKSVILKDFKSTNILIKGSRGIGLEKLITS